MSSPGYHQGAGGPADDSGPREPLREPLHQPPDPRDLAAFPPQSSACAMVRGQLRDFVDGDLSNQQRSLVEQHVHECRTCAVALSRAEHEVLLLQRTFAAIAREEGPRLPGARALGGVAPRPGFAARVVNRLVMDETSLLSREALSREALSRAAAQAKTAAATPAAATPANVPSRPLASRPLAGAAGLLRRFEQARWAPGAAQSVLLTVAVLVLVAIGAAFFDGGDGRPENSPRLVITAAEDTYGDFGMPLGLGDGLRRGAAGDHSLWRAAE